MELEYVDDEMGEDEALEGEYASREDAEEARQAQIAALTQSIVKKRSEAVSGRKNSGIEEEWQEDEDFYQGIDDANRDTVSKPLSHTGGAVGVRKVSTTRSTVFLNITRPYVDAASARFGDLLLPTDDRNFSIKPTPIPELMDAMGDTTQVTDPAGNPVMHQPNLNDYPAGAFGGMPTNMPGVGDKPDSQMGAMPVPNMQPRPMTVGDLAAKKLGEARKRAEAAQTRIDDWLVQCGFNQEMRKAIHDCARLGTGVLKGPVPKKFKYRRASAAQGGMMALEIIEDINPASKRVDPWNLFPDPNCGENIQDGNFLFERDFLTARQLRDLVGLPDYDSDAIAQVLEEGPKMKNEATRRTAKDDERFEVWYYYGFIEKDDLEAMGCECDSDLENIPAILTLVNDSVIKATISPIESGEYPFDVMPYQERAGQPWGIGVGRQLNTVQRMLNAATRNMMDNAGLSAGPQIVMKKGVVTPADGKWEISPRKYWWINEDADAMQVQHAFMAIQIPSMQAELNNIIQFALQMAERVTGITWIINGQQGPVTGPAAETVGGMTMMMNNATTVLRRLARIFDERITKPHISRYYDWLMVYGEDESEKGDFAIDARGSSTLVERDIQNQAVLQMGQLVMNPAFGISPERWIKEAMKVQRLDAEKFLLTDEEKQAMQQAAQQQAQQQGGGDTSIQVAQIKAEIEKYKADKNAELQMLRVQKDTDRDQAYIVSMDRRDQTMAQMRMQELAMKREIAAIELANKQQLSLQDAKTKLADTAMKLKTQVALSRESNAARQVVKPAAEPKGKAENGKAFQQ